MAFLNPKKWNVVCWLLLLLWLYPSVLGNLPFEPELDEFDSSKQSAAGSQFVDYGHVYVMGWPFGYFEIATQKLKPPVRTYKPVMFVLNCVLVIATLTSLIYAVQKWLPRFSIRMMLFGMTIVAVLIAIGQVVFSTDYFYLQWGFMMAVSFSPIVAALAFIFYDRIRLSKRRA